MNHLRETLLNFCGGGRRKRMFRMISLDRTRVPHAAGFSRLFFVAHATKFTRSRNFYLDRLLKCLTCEQWP